MQPWLKWTLGISAGLIGLKLWNDSKAIGEALKAKANTSPASNFIAGQNIPNPSGGHTGSTVVTPEARLSNSNADVDYGRGYLNIAEGYS